MRIVREVQNTLALLWRTMDVIKDFDDNSLVSVYEELFSNISGLPDLSLSMYWKPDLDKNGKVIEPHLFSDGCEILNITTLKYLKREDQLNLKHDPLDLINKLYRTASDVVHDQRFREKDRETLLSACLMLSVKAGRAGLLLRTVNLILNSVGSSATFDIILLRDVFRFVYNATQINPQATLSSANEAPTMVTDPLEVFGYRRIGRLTARDKVDVSRSVWGQNGRKERGGLIVSFGKADHGKLGHGDTQLHRLVPTVIEPLREVDLVCAASMSTYALAADSHGQVWVWGSGGSQAGSGALKTDISPQILEALPPKAAVIDISCGLGHALFLLRSGRVHSWGNGGNGRLGHGDFADRAEACNVIALNGLSVTAVMCGASHSMALTSTGRVYCWGKNSQGQCGVGRGISGPDQALMDVLRPVKVGHQLEEVVVVQLAAGWEHSLALTVNGKMYSWGCGYKDSRRGVIPPVLGHGNNEGRASPELICAIESVTITRITCGWDHCLALDDCGQVYSWGSGQNGKLGQGTEENIAIPEHIAALDRHWVETIAAGCEHSACVTREGAMLTWGHGDGGRLGHGSNMQRFLPTEVAAVKQMGLRPAYVHCGDKFTMVLLERPAAECCVDPFSQAEDGANSPPSACGSFGRLLGRLKCSGVDRSSGELVDVALLNPLADRLNRTLGPRGAGLPTGPSEQLSRDDFVASLLFLMSRAASLPRKRNIFNVHDQDGVDREFSVECGAEMLAEIVQLLEVLWMPYCLHLGALAADATCGDLQRSFEPLYSFLIVCAANLEAMALATSPNSGVLFNTTKERPAYESSLESASAESGSHDGDESRFGREGIGSRTYSDDLSESDDRRGIAAESSEQRNVYTGTTREGRRNGRRVSSGRQQQNDDHSYYRREDDEDENKSAYDRYDLSSSVRDYSRGGDSIDEDDEDSLFSRGENAVRRGNNRDSLHSRGSRSDGRRYSCSDDFLSQGGTRYGYGDEGSDYYDEGSDYGRESPAADFLESSYRTAATDHSAEYSTGGADSSSVGRTLYRDFDGSDTDNDGGTMGLPIGSSPAPSFESLEQHPHRRREETRSFDGPEGRSPGGDDEMLSEREAAMREDMELQRAIISSIAEQEGDRAAYGQRSQMESYAPYDSCKRAIKALGADTDVPSAVDSVARIRDLINSLASQCFVSLESTAAFIGKEQELLSASVRSVYAVWESAQAITSKGFRLLYCEEDSRTVLCQVVQSPAAFLYVVPGLVSGILTTHIRSGGDKSTAAESDRGVNLIWDALPIAEVMLADGDDSSSPLRLADLTSFLGFVLGEVQAARETQRATVSPDTACQEMGAACASAMYGRVIASLAQISAALVAAAVSKLDDYHRRATNNDLKDLSAGMPWGREICNVFAAVAQCVAADLSVLTTKCDSSREDFPELARAQCSFAALTLPTVFAALMSHSDSALHTTRAADALVVAALPFALSLLDLFTAHLVYGGSAFQKWLKTQFQWVVYFIAHCASRMTAGRVEQPLLTSDSVFAHLFDFSTLTPFDATNEAGFVRAHCTTWSESLLVAVGCLSAPSDHSLPQHLHHSSTRSTAVKVCDATLSTKMASLLHAISSTTFLKRMGLNRSSHICNGQVDALFHWDATAALPAVKLLQLALFELLSHSVHDDILVDSVDPVSSLGHRDVLSHWLLSYFVAVLVADCVCDSEKTSGSADIANRVFLASADNCFKFCAASRYLSGIFEPLLSPADVQSILCTTTEQQAVLDLLINRFLLFHEAVCSTVQRFSRGRSASLVSAAVSIRAPTVDANGCPPVQTTVLLTAYLLSSGVISSENVPSVSELQSVALGDAIRRRNACAAVEVVFRVLRCIVPTATARIYGGDEEDFVQYFANCLRSASEGLVSLTDLASDGSNSLYFPRGNPTAPQSSESWLNIGKFVAAKLQTSGTTREASALLEILIFCTASMVNTDRCSPEISSQFFAVVAQCLKKSQIAIVAEAVGSHQSLVLLLEAGHFVRTCLKAISCGCRIFPILSLPHTLLADIAATCGHISHLLVESSLAFHRHLDFCRAHGAQYLCPGVRALEQSSPVVVPSLFAPQARFSLGFWLFLPVETICEELCGSDGAAPSEYIVHLVSRVLETSDTNLVALLSGKNPVTANDSVAASGPFAYSLNISLVAAKNRDSSRRRWSLRVSAVAVEYTHANRASLNASLIAKQKAVRTLVAEAHDIQFGSWNSVLVTLSQDATVPDKPEPGEISQAEKVTRRTARDKRVNTQVRLYLGGVLRSQARGPGGVSALHQTVVIGKIPTELGHIQRLTEREKTFASFDGKTPVSMSAEPVHILLADVFWLPTVTDTTNAEHADVSADGAVTPLDYPVAVLTDALQVFQLCAREALFAATLLMEAAPTTEASYEAHDQFCQQIPALFAFALHYMCTGDAVTQGSAVKMVTAVLNYLGQRQKFFAISDTVRAAISAFLGSALALVRCVTRADLTVSLTGLESASQLVWRNRLLYGRVSLDKSLRTCSWSEFFMVDDRVVVEGVASWTTLSAALGVVLECDTRDLLIVCAASGGCPPTLAANRLVDVCPRKLFLHTDLRGRDYTAFPTEATLAVTNSSAAAAVWLGDCEGAAARCGLAAECEQTQSSDLVSSLLCATVDAPGGLVVPAGRRAVFPLTESVVARDLVPLAKVDLLESSLTHTAATVLPATGLIELLKAVVAPTLVGGRATSEQDLTTTATCGETVEARATLFQRFISFAQQMSLLRALLAQTTNTQAAAAARNKADDQWSVLRRIVADNLGSLVSVALLDPVQTVTAAFSSSTFRGLQLDVLRNLLKEGDLAFLESVAGQFWKQFRLDPLVCTEAHYGVSATVWDGTVHTPLSSLVHMTALAGEVVVGDSKVRALSHFPSVRLLGVSLERCSGRWYYEVTLLSDGLMQIGWANAQFQCDPICGQGVGDHASSWAYDGLRTKKWNVSCEPYGRRWRLGDVVGALLDTDLLEMRFFLNGEDLGTAFEDFAAGTAAHHNLFPAFSLNVRQSVRLNFGQHRFMFPPDEADGKSFKPVIEALMPKAALATVSGVDVAPAKSTAKPRSIARQDSGGSVVSNASAIGGSNNNNNSSNNLMNQLAHVRTQVAQSVAPGASSSATSANSTHRQTDSETAEAKTDGASPSGVAMMTANSNNAAESSEADETDGGTQYNAQYDYRYDLVDKDGEDEGEDAETSNDQKNSTAAEDAEEARQERILLQNAQRARNRNSVVDSDLLESNVDRTGAEGEEEEEEEEVALRFRRAGNDDEEDEEEEEEEEDNDDEGDEDEDDSRDGEENSALMELRRQAMVESLIGMGFPVDWALRAAEQCEVSTSESAAISWIIERMELEQSKILDSHQRASELEGDSSRVADEEEFDQEAAGAAVGDQDDTGRLEYFMQRHAAALALNGGAGHGSVAAERLAELQSNGLMSTGNSPSRGEAFGIRRSAAVLGVPTPSGLTSATVGSDAAFGGATPSLAARLAGGYSRANSLGSAGLLGWPAGESSLGDGDDAGGDLSGYNAAWNDLAPMSDGVNYPPMLPGQYTIGRRHDQDKQDVLAQVANLDWADMAPIIAACEFALCISYARALLSRALQLECLTVALKTPTVAAVVAVANPEGSRNTCFLHATKPLLWSFVTSLEPNALCELLKVLFKQQMVAATSQPFRLLPCMSNGNCVGDVRDRLPPVRPYVSHKRLLLHALLSRYELSLFPHSGGTLCTDETSIQSAATVTQLLDIIIDGSYYSGDVAPPNGALTRSATTGGGYSSISSGTTQLQTAVLRGIGIDLQTGTEEHSNTTQDSQSSFQEACGLLLSTAIEDALRCLERAAAITAAEMASTGGTGGGGESPYEDLDWVADGVDRDSPHPATAQTSHVLWAYWALRHTLYRQLNMPVATIDIHAPVSSISDSVNTLVSATTLTRLFGLLVPSESSSPSPSNASLRCFLYDLSAAILARLNLVNDASEVNPGRAESFEYCTAIAKDASLMLHFSRRLRFECGEKRLFSRYLRTMTGLLFQCWSLRRALGFSNPLHGELHRYAVDELSAVCSRDVRQVESATSHVASSPPRLYVSQLSANSITVAWANIPTIDGLPAAGDDNEKGTGWSVCVTVAASSWSAVEDATGPGLTLAVRNIESNGSFCAEDLESDSLYRISVVRDDELLALHSRQLELEARRRELLSQQEPAKFCGDGNNITEPDGLDEDDDDDEGDDDDDAEEDSFGDNSREADMLHFLAKLKAAQDEIFNFPTVSEDGNSSERLDSEKFPKDEKEEEEEGKPQLETPAKNREQISVTNPLPLIVTEEDHSSSAVDRNVRAAEDATTKKSSVAEASCTDTPELSDAPIPTTALVLHEPLLTLLAGTESEAAFQFDSDNVSPNIVLSSAAHHAGNQITLRNYSNKKWSTARANIRMTSGTHRWDVHVDRCVSKNIFIGVMGPESRLDNYVGCDRYGWAFLANKAVWHNKAKVKAYGEFFRTGDTVSVLLDLDAGTLSFVLNHERHLGVAFENVCGPVYPAFSLYNEDDQLTIVHIRSSGGSAPSGGANSPKSSLGSFAAERVLDRVRVVSALLSYLSRDYGDSSCARESDNSLSLEVCAELHLRWSLLREHGVPCRSFIVNSSSTASNSFEFVTIQASEAAVALFTSGTMHLHDLTVADGGALSRVVGVAAHRLWLQQNVSGELTGYCADSLASLLDSGSISVIRDEVLCTMYTNAFHVVENRIGPLCAAVAEQQPSEISVLFGKKPSSIYTMINTRTPGVAWTRSDDLELLLFIGDVARERNCDPFSVSAEVWVRQSHLQTSGQVVGCFGRHSTESVLLRIVTVLHTNDLLLPLLPLLAPRSVSPGLRLADECPSNYPTAQIVAARGVILPMIKSEFARRLVGGALGGSSAATHLVIPDQACQNEPKGSGTATLTELRRSAESPTIGCSVPEARTPASSSVKAPLETELPQQQQPTTASLGNSLTNRGFADLGIKSAGGTPVPALSRASSSSSASAAAAAPSTRPLVLLVESEWAMNQRIYSHAAAAKQKSSYSVAELLSDNRWRLVTGYQCSLLGQLIRFLERVSCLNSCSSTGTLSLGGVMAGSLAQIAAGNNAAAWEHALRNRCHAGSMTLLWSSDESVRPADKQTPFLLRRRSGPDFAAISWLDHLLAIAAAERETPAIEPTDDRQFDSQGATRISEYQVYAAFVEEAAHQVGAFFRELFAFAPDEDEMDDKEDGDIALGAAQMSLVLQIVHATGVLAGLAIRTGIAISLPLPRPFYDVLSAGGREHGQVDTEQFLKEVAPVHSKQALATTCALVMRAGVTAVVPEAVLDLLLPEEVHRLFVGAPGDVSVHKLRRQAVGSTRDIHVQYFWGALGELSTTQLRRFLQVVTTASAVPQCSSFQSDSYRGTSFSSVQLHIVTVPDDSPSENCDSTPITRFVVTEKNVASPQPPLVCGLRLPKYSSVNAAHQQLLAFI